MIKIVRGKYINEEIITWISIYMAYTVTIERKLFTHEDFYSTELVVKMEI